MSATVIRSTRRVLNNEGEIRLYIVQVILETLTDLNLHDCSENELKLIMKCVKISNLNGYSGEELRAMRKWSLS